MSDIAYISENKIFRTNGAKTEELSCGRLNSYKSALADIRRRNEWKTTGTGARFMGQGRLPDEEQAAMYCEITGLACYNGDIVYAIRLDESGGIYIRSSDRADTDETLIVSGKDIFPGRMSCKGRTLYVSCGENSDEKHISIYDEIPSSRCREITDGDTIEESPVMHDGKLYFSTAGYARNEYGSIAAVQNKSIVCFDPVSGTMDEVLSDEKYDYICPIPDGEGGMFCIRQPAGGESAPEGNPVLDIILFPVRLIKAIINYLNFFSMAFGGEALKNGGNSPERSKKKSDKQMFIEGNLVNAEKNMKAEESRGEKYPGIMPPDRLLLHVAADGSESIVRRGVLDYTLMSDGSLAVSNGGHIIFMDRNGDTKSAVKAAKAVSVIELTGGSQSG